MLVIRGLILLFILLFTAFFGCADDLFQTGNTVTVHLTDKNGFDFTTRDVFTNVSLGNYPISLTNETGRCNFSNSPIPYDLTIQTLYYYQIFKNVSIPNPEIVTIFDDPSYSYISCYFKANLLLPGPSQLAILRFISQDKFYERSDNYILFGGSHYQFDRNVKIPASVSSISGKLLLMYCNGYNDNGEVLIFSFDSLSTKDIVLHPGNNDSIVFSNNDMVGNIPHTSFEYSVISNKLNTIEAYFTFPGYHNNSDILFYRMNYPGNSIIVPTNLTLPFEIKLKSILLDPSNVLIPQVISKGLPGTNFYLQHKEIQLIEPADNQTGVNENTVIRFDDNIEPGIYAIEINYDNVIFTEKKEITLKYMENRGFYLRNNSRYRWKVYKLSTFNNINDFLSASYILRDNFTNISSSEYREFTTVP